MKKGHLFVFIGQTTSDLLSPKWILTKCIEFDGCLWCSWGCVLSWGYHASVHFIILRASNSQSGSLGLVLFECSFNGTGYHFITLFPCYGCFFSFQTRDFTGDSGACADKCIFAYCFDTWKILIMSKLNLDNRIKHNMFIGEIQCPEMKLLHSVNVYCLLTRSIVWRWPCSYRKRWGQHLWFLQPKLCWRLTIRYKCKSYQFRRHQILQSVYQFGYYCWSRMILGLEQSLVPRWSQTMRWTFPHRYQWSYMIRLFPYLF